MKKKITDAQLRQMLDDAAEWIRPEEDAAAAEEVAAAEAAENVRRSAGRPTLGGEPSEQIAVRMPASTHRALLARAEAEHKTVAALVREAIDQRLVAS